MTGSTVIAALLTVVVGGLGIHQLCSSLAKMSALRQLAAYLASLGPLPSQIATGAAICIVAAETTLAILILRRPTGLELAANAGLWLAYSVFSAARAHSEKGLRCFCHGWLLADPPIGLTLGVCLTCAILAAGQGWLTSPLASSRGALSVEFALGIAPFMMHGLRTLYGIWRGRFISPYS